MKQFIGIDVSKAKLDCLWLRDPDNLKIKTKVLRNDKAGHTQLCDWLTTTTNGNAEDIIVVMEATGIYHEVIAYALYKAGFGVAVVNPAQIKAFGKSLGQTHKTDKQDSLVIARYGWTQKPSLWQPEPLEIRELKSLIARLEALETDHRRESNRLEKAEFSVASLTVIESINTMLQELSQEKARVEKEINDHIDRHDQLKKDRQLLESIPGIGAVVSRMMLSVIHSREFTRASEVAAYVGVIPTITESGIFRGRSRLSKKGPARVRAKLYMAAIVASQHNPDIIDQRQRLLANGKTKMQALGAGMRKLVHICFGVIKNQTKYSPQAI
jgi:transposase